MEGMGPTIVVPYFRRKPMKQLENDMMRISPRANRPALSVDPRRTNSWHNWLAGNRKSYCPEPRRPHLISAFLASCPSCPVMDIMSPFSGRDSHTSGSVPRCAIHQHTHAYQWNGYLHFIRLVRHQSIHVVGALTLKESPIIHHLHQSLLINST